MNSLIPTANDTLIPEAKEQPSVAEPVVAPISEVIEVIIDDTPVTAEPTPVPVVTEPIIDDTPVTEVKDKAAVPRPKYVLQEYDINAPVNLDTGDELILPSNYDKETRIALENSPNISLVDNPDARDWANTVSEGLSYTSFNETFVPTLEEAGGDFKHRIEQAGISLNAQAPKFKETENQNLKGDRAVIRLITHLGLGTLFQTPLWHSGIWLTFKPPSESEIVELNRMLISDKIKFGRYTYGLAFSNTTSYTVDRLIDFAISHVYDITSKVEDIKIENLKNHISCQDIPSLLWGFICTMYPRGFKYRRACITEPDKCNFVLEETLNIAKLQWTNNNSLSEWQKVFMSGRQPKSKDLATIKRYKEELTQLQNKKIEINKDTPQSISLTIKTPTISEYIDSGHRWIGDIVEVVNKAISTDATDSERNNLIIKYGQASAMRQYSHWIESIEYGSNIIDDRETIETTLDVLSADDEVRSQFISAVIDYINKSTISIIGIPVFDCPKCNGVQEGSSVFPNHTNVIPLDIIQIFFGLLSQRLDRMTER